MSDKEARKEDQPSTVEPADQATEKAEERKLSVDDIDSDKAEDVKGGAIRTNMACAGGDG